MGSLFKTTTPQNVDFMYQLPENMMYKATQQISQDITQNQASVYDLYGKLPLNANPNDKERAAEIVAGYEDKVDELTSQLQADPLAFRRKAGEIIGLGREIHKDYTRGEAAAIGDRYAGYVDYGKRQQEMVKTGKITDLESVNLNLANYLKEDKERGMQWNPQTGDYNRFNPNDLLPTVDFQKKYSEFAKEIIPEKTTKKTVGSDGKYIYTNEVTGEIRTQDDIMKILNDRFALDFETQNFLKQRSSFGALQGWYTPKGEFITSDKEGSAYAKMLRVNMEAFDIHNMSVKKDMKVDSYGLPTQRAEVGYVVVDNNNIAEVKKVSNFAPVDVTKPETLPLGQQNIIIKNLQRDNSTRLIGAAEKLVTLIPKNAILEKDKNGVSIVGTELKKLAENGDTKGMKALAGKYGVQGSEVDDAIYQIESNKRQIATIKSQQDMYVKMAMHKLGYIDTNYGDLTDETRSKIDNIANSMMVDPVINEPISRSIKQTEGSIFDDPNQRKMYNEGLTKIKKDVLNGTMPLKFIVSRPVTSVDASGKPIKKIISSEMTNEDFQTMIKEQYKNAHSKGTKKKNYTDSGSGETGLEYGYKEDKTINVSKVLQPISTDDGITYNKPYSVDYGNNITVYLESSTVNAPQMDALLATKNTQIEVQNTIDNLNAMAMPGLRAKQSNSPVATLTAPILNDDIQYTTPDREGGVGYFTIKLDKPKKNADGTLITTVVIPANNKSALEEIYSHINKH